MFNAALGDALVGAHSGSMFMDSDIMRLLENADCLKVFASHI